MSPAFSSSEASNPSEGLQAAGAEAWPVDNPQPSETPRGRNGQMVRRPHSSLHARRPELLLALFTF